MKDLIKEKEEKKGSDPFFFSCAKTVPE